MNKVIIFLSICCCFFQTSAQQIADVSLKLSLKQSLLVGERSTLTLELENKGNESVYFLGYNLEAMQADGFPSARTVEFDYNSLTGYPSCHFDYSLVPLSYKDLSLIFELEANSVATCQIDFFIPKNFEGDFINFSYKIDVGTRFDDPNLKNNEASARITVEKSRARHIPTLSHFGLILMIITVLFAYLSRRIKVHTMISD